MVSDTQRPFRLGSWLVEPDLNRLSQDEEAVQLEPKTMEVLLCLCRQPGEVLSADQIIAEVWDNRPMGDNPVYKAIAKLRKALDDNSGHTQYIQTVSKKGYRLVATIDEPSPQTTNTAAPDSGGKVRRLALPVTLGILIGVALAAALFWQPAVSPPTLTGMSTFPGSHRQPTFAPDGERIAFVNTESGFSHIWTLAPGQVTPQQLTFGETHNRRPRWSPDGETILFGRGNSIWSVPAAGGEAVELIRDAYNSNWSRDGSRIVFERRYEIWLADADGGQQDRLPGVPKRELPLAARWPAFSPDGSEIVFFNPQSSPMGDLWRIGIDGSGLQQLTFATAFGGAPVWSPDGTSITYSSERNGNRDLWMVDVDTLSEKLLFTTGGNSDHPDYSADSSRLVYSLGRERFTLLASDPSDSSSEILFQSRLQLYGPELSSDGQALTFFGSSRNGGVQIFRLPLDGGEISEVTANPQAIHGVPQWSSDSQSIYFYFTAADNYFAVIPADGGDPSVVAQDWTWDTAHGARVSPDESAVIYSRLSGQTPVQTLVRDLASGNDSAFYATLEFPRWSSDGGEVIGSLHVDQRFPGDVAVCPAAGTECRILAQGGRAPVWSTDNERIYFVRGFGASQELFVIPTDGSGAEQPVMQLAPLHALGHFYQVTEDNKIIWVRYDREPWEIWAADL